MLNYRPSDACELAADGDFHHRRARDRSKAVTKDERVEIGWSFDSKLGRETILLELVEFRVLAFLAANPYRAFSGRRIADAISTERHPVTSQTLSRHITSLRRKLGFFADFIQTVPHIGYRYKA